MLEEIFLGYLYCTHVWYFIVIHFITILKVYLSNWTYLRLVTSKIHWCLTYIFLSKRSSDSRTCFSFLFILFPYFFYDDVKKILSCLFFFIIWVLRTSLNILYNIKKRYKYGRNMSWNDSYESKNVFHKNCRSLNNIKKYSIRIFDIKKLKNENIKENRVIRNLTYTGKILCNTIDTNISIYLIQHINVTHKKYIIKNQQHQERRQFLCNNTYNFVLFLKNTTVSFLIICCCWLLLCHFTLVFAY